MSIVKNQHYLSRCISKNFIITNNRTFYEYDCSDYNVDKQIKEKNIGKLFSARRIWGQDFEQKLNEEFENKLAVILRKYVNIRINRTRLPLRTHLEEVQFNGRVIESEEDKNILSKLLIQQLLLQKKNKMLIDDEYEKILSSFLQCSGVLKGNIVLVEVNPLALSCPLILIDSMIYVYFIPNMKNNDNLGHIQFMFPISPSRFLLWGNKQDIDYFCKKYKNIHYLNLCRIEQQEKKCRIATQDKDYLELLIKDIDAFSSGNIHVKVTSMRDMV